MQFLDIRIGAFFCFLNVFGIAVPALIYKKHPTWSSIITVPYCGLPNDSKLCDFMH